MTTLLHGLSTYQSADESTIAAFHAFAMDIVGVDALHDMLQRHPSGIAYMWLSFVNARRTQEYTQ
jgi:hypothetical protein